MQPDLKTLKFRKREGVKYTFNKAGDILPMHTHGEADVHISILTSPFKVRGKGWEQEYPKGTVLSWEPGQFHEFEAMEDNSYLVNIIDA